MYSFRLASDLSRHLMFSQLFLVGPSLAELHDLPSCNPSEIWEAFLVSCGVVMGLVLLSFQRAGAFQ